MPGKTFTTHRADEDGISRQLPFISVPDGKWVLVASEQNFYEADPDGVPVPSLLLGSQFEIVGPVPQRTVLEENLSEFFEAWTWLLVGAEPFGIVKDEHGEVWLQLARQIHKGGLGRKPPLELPEVVREPRRSRAYPIVQNPGGWVRVADVAERVGMQPVEMLTTYYDFDHDSSGLLWIMEATPDQIRTGEGHSSHFLGCNTIELFLKQEEIERHGREAWIRLGFAQTILHLHRFDWKSSHNRHLELLKLIDSLRTAARLLDAQYPMRARELETWIGELAGSATPSL